MEHTVFGRIEPFGSGWTGRVQIGFFSDYDPVLTDHGKRLGLGDWGTPPDKATKKASSSWRWLAKAAAFPPGSGKRPFATSSEIRMDLQSRRRCNLRLLPSELGELATQGRAGSSGTDTQLHILTPELRTRDGLKSVISLAALYVLDVPNGELAVLGFSFGCSWDVEHGLGVLVRGGEVIEIGDDSITWNAPEFAERTNSFRPPTQQKSTSKTYCRHKRLGGSEQL